MPRRCLPTEGNGEHLQAAAYAEQRYAGRGGCLDQGDLAVVASAIDVAGDRGVCAGQEWVDILAAGEDYGVDHVQQVHRLGPWQQHGPTSGGDQPVEVPGRAAGHG